MRIALIGSNGQLGWELSEALSAAGNVVERYDRARLDVTDFTAIAARLSETAYDVVFNCTAYNAVDHAESDEDSAITINATAVAAMSAACRRAGARFVHYSTDYVFGDGFDVPINETRPTGPLSAYGRSKRLGEELALTNNPGNTLVIRTTGLYSDRRSNFVTTMLRLAADGRALNVVNDQFVAPTWVRPLAALSLKLLDTSYSGILHAVSHGECTWHELAARAFELEGLDANLSPTTAAEWGAAARRPRYSVLDNAILRTLGLDEFEPWDVMLERFFRETR